MREIVSYLMRTYAPAAVIVYGSFAEGTNGPQSDFDALVIADCPAPLHDTATVAGTQLDVFVEPTAAFRAPYDPMRYVRLEDGVILCDTDGLAAGLIAAVKEAIGRGPQKTPQELREDVGWCEKMLRRAERGDAQGLYRLHWLLTDSLEIYTQLCGRRYCGPKKALRAMEADAPQEFALYRAALENSDVRSAAAWVALLRRRCGSP